MVGLYDKRPHRRQPRTYSRTQPPRMLQQGFQRKRIGSMILYVNVCDKGVSISQRLIYFDATVTPAACVTCVHRKISKQDLRKLNIKFRKLVRAILGLSGGLDWLPPWYDIFQEWNAFHVGMCRSSWRQILVPELPGTDRTNDRI